MRLLSNCSASLNVSTVLAFVALSAVSVAHAGDGLLSEVRAGVLVHDAGPFADREEDGVDYNRGNSARKTQRPCAGSSSSCGFRSEQCRRYEPFLWRIYLGF